MDPPFLIFLADASSVSEAKTGAGLAYWRPGDCAGQLRLPPSDVTLGLPDLDLDAAVAAGVQSLVIGVAPLGGRLPPHWLDTLEAAARRGLHIINGLHDRLTAYSRVVAAAAATGAKLIDLRVPPQNIPVGTGARRSGMRALTVGTDCAVGKKYSALALTREMTRRGVSTSFCATGQTGIMISGRGVPLDAVPCDFISGAIEDLSPAGPADHWDVIEGQGSIFHPSYAGVTLGLIHGAQADALILCHDASRTNLDDLPSYPIASLTHARDVILQHARLTNPRAQFVGVCLNTSGLAPQDAERACDRAAHELGVPACDPIRSGVEAIASQCLALSSAPFEASEGR